MNSESYSKMIITCSFLAMLNIAGIAHAQATEEVAARQPAVTAEAGLSSAATEKNASKNIAGPIIWIENVDEAIKTAASSNKKIIMVNVYTSWCGWCKKFEKDTLGSKNIGEQLEKFVCARVNPEEDEAFSAKYNVKEFPTVIFLKADGTELERHSGFMGAAEFQKILKAVIEKK